MTHVINILLALGALGALGLLLGAVASIVGYMSGEEKKNPTALSEDLPADKEDKNKLCAFIRCAGQSAERKYTYVGAEDCLAASLLAGGMKSCEYSCLGLGSCAEVCKFGAITTADGVCTIDSGKCTGCGECIKVCPRRVIELVPQSAVMKVQCSNCSLGSKTRKICEVGCIGCLACVKNCKYGAIKVEGSLASIDYSKCVCCSTCAEVCPRGIITAPPKEEVAEEESFDESEYFKLQIEGDETPVEQEEVTAEE